MLPPAGVVPGHRDKYALVERERRFLLAGPPRGGGGAQRDITDHYLTGTRLRRVTGGGRLGVASRGELLSWVAEFGVDADAGS